MSDSQQRARALLSDLTILECGVGGAVAFATRKLADLGATVIKVEPPSPDGAARGAGVIPEGAETSSLFAYLNAGKRSVALDLRSGPGRSGLRRLIERCDVVVDDHPATFWDETGRTFDALPGMGRCRLAVSITPFGRSGARADWLASNLNVVHAGGEAYTFPGGISWLTYPEREPVKTPGRLGELDAGLSAAIIMLAWALTDRGATAVELSAQEALLVLSRVDAISTYPHEGMLQTRASRSLPILGETQCKDGWLQIMPSGDGSWERLVKAIGDPEWAHELGETDALRQQHREEINALFGVWAIERTTNEVFRLLETEGVPVGKVRSLAEALASEQMHARGFFGELDWPAGRRTRVPGHPYLIHQPDGTSWRPGPDQAGPAQLGQHTEELLQESCSAEPSGAPAKSSLRERPDAGATCKDAPGRWLSGVRVVDLTWMQAGPYAGAMLAALGAEVIKVESTARLDRFRSMLPPDCPSPDSLDRSYRFNEVNLGKRSVQLDLTTDTGRQVLERLLVGADMMISSFRPGVIERMGFGFDRVKQINPQLVMLTVAANGATGPAAHLPGLAAIFAAESGLSGISGYDTSMPAEYRGAVDSRVGTAAAFAALVGLLARERLGTGLYVDLSAVESCAELIGDHFLDWQVRGAVDAPLADHDPGLCPHNCYPCRHDGGPGWVTVAVETAAQWQALVALLGSGELDPAWDQPARKTRETLIDRVVEAWLCERERDQAVAELQAAHVPAGPSMSARDIYVDAHLRSRGMWTSVAHGEMGPMEVLAPPWLIDGERLPLRPAPLFGADNGYVYEELLGLDGRSIRGLHEAGVIR